MAEFRVYYVESKDDPTALVALDINVVKDQNAVTWIDTVKERRVNYQKIEEIAGGFNVETTDGRIYQFRAMTLDIYNEKVKEKLAAKRNFSTEEEMLSAFEETKKDIW